MGNTWHRTLSRIVRQLYPDFRIFAKPCFRGWFYVRFAISFILGEKKSGARSYRRKIDSVGSDSLLLLLLRSFRCETRSRGYERGWNVGMGMKIVGRKYWCVEEIKWRKGGRIGGELVPSLISIYQQS